MPGLVCEKYFAGSAPAGTEENANEETVGVMKDAVELRVRLTEPQALKLQQRLAALPFKANYQEEQHGATLVVLIGCSSAQEKTLRGILHEIGAAIAEPSDE
jgi:hypothetical protein